MKDLFAVKKQWMVYLSVMLLVIALGYFYRLTMPSMLLVLAAAIGCMPWLLKINKQKHRQQRRFMEVNLYMEQILYSFRKNPKIFSALSDVEKLFSSGKMLECIGQAREHIAVAYGEEVPEEQAFLIIEEAYPSNRIAAIHRLMLEVERLGGRYEDSVRILQNDRSVWEKQTFVYQKQCSVQKRNILAAELLSSMFCLMTPVLCNGFLQDIDITGSLIYQITTVAALLMYLGIFLITEKCFYRDWIRERNSLADKSLPKKYEKVVQYDFGKARAKSFMWAIAPGLIMVIFLVRQHYLGAVFFLLLFIVMINQHKMDYALAKKAVVHEIEKAFPVWLMEVSLLLQNNNVQVSIQKSLDKAPKVLVPALEILVDRLQEMPESNLPYSEFLQEFQIAEVVSAMGMLYSISDGGGGDAREQIEEILMRNTELMSQAEALSNQDKLGEMYLLFLVPALLGALKMIIDMTLLLGAFFVQVHI